MRRKHQLIGGALLVVLLLTALVAVSCGGSDTTTTAPAANTTVSSGSTGAAVDAAALYAENCAGCHKNVPGGKADAVQKTIESGKESMPSFTDKLSAEQIAALAAWVAAGGK
jgi:mono/diheme cytochrome c family protein